MLCGVKMMSSMKNNPVPPNLNKPVTDEAILKVTKEIVVKFIEAGRLSPTTFEETFARVYKTVLETVRP